MPLARRHIEVRVQVVYAMDPPQPWSFVFYEVYEVTGEAVHSQGTATVNGLEGSVWVSVVTAGWPEALLSLFGVSAIVWIACFAAVALLYGSGE